VAFTVYVILYYPRKAEPFEINTSNPTQDILIATQGSDFKNALVKTLCDSLRQSSAHVKGVDVGSLAEVNDEDWDRILIICTFMVRLNRDVNRFVDSASTPERILLFVTSGGADWQPEPELMVDAVTSASRKVYIESLVRLITGWLTREGDQKWHPDDYLLALRYFPRVDVKAACEAIALERERYMALYPDLVGVINQVGYQYLRLKDVTSAFEVFRLNVSLFPDHWNVYDSYGEVLLIMGDRESAIRNYRRALELNPDSKSAKDVLKQLEEG
jgi:tetratricopeptide (TPR) repeat protein